MKSLCLLVVSLFSACALYGQSNVLMGQYFQNMPAVAPGLTGANDYLDIRTGYRQQWAGYEGAPKTLFFSCYGVKRLKHNPYKENSVRVSNLTPYEKNGMKIGLGGYLMNDELGAFRQMQGMLNVAVHVPIHKSTYLTLGISSGLNKSEIDLNKLFVLDPNDDRYEAYIENGPDNTYLKLNAGMALYSPRYYLSYSTMHLVHSMISGNETVNTHDPIMQHNVLVGFRFSLNPEVELIPNGYVRYSDRTPLVFDTGVRLRYKRNLYAGLSYRNDNSFISMAGFTFDDKFKIGYSYEHKFLDYKDFNPGSHEIVVGVQLFNYNKHTAVW